VTVRPIVALVALLLAAPASAKAPAKPVKGSVKWEPSFAAAMKKAKAESKPVMIDFWADWCGYCHMLDRTTYRDPAVVRRSASMVSVKVDAEGSDDEVLIASRYLVGSLPTILFISPGGRTILRLNGYLPPARFDQALAELEKRLPLVMGPEGVLAKDPNDVDSLIKLGLHVYVQVTQMAERDPEQRMSKVMFEDAMDLLTRAQRLDRERPSTERKSVRGALGLLYAYGGKYAEAEATLKEALALSPTDADHDVRALSSLGELYLQQKKNDLARDTFKKLVERYPESEEAAIAKQYLKSLQGKS
jgi:tetratricopeptide (TPR) repeat protein